jgi:hypothetical protein
MVMNGEVDEDRREILYQKSSGCEETRKSFVENLEAGQASEASQI